LSKVGEGDLNARNRHSRSEKYLAWQKFSCIYQPTSSTLANFQFG